MVKKTKRSIENPGKHSNKTRITAALLVFVLLGSGVALVFSNSGSNQNDDNEFSSNILPTNCPKNDKSSPRTIDFVRRPPRCIEPQKTHTAVFDTTEGEIRVLLDTSLTPNTTNNFVVLTNYGYYDNTLLFRLDPSIGIIQGGSPHTNDWSDPGPGYTISDEGGLFLPLSNGGVKGPFTYSPGQLIMARSSGLNSSGAQFFFSTGEEVSLLDNQGSYIVFGETDTQGLSILKKMMDLYKKDDTSPYGGGPERQLIIRSVSIEIK